jgi:hypothetical protein
MENKAAELNSGIRRTIEQLANETELKLPVYWVFTAISLEELVRVVLGLRKVWTRSWLRHLTHAPVIAMNAVYEG